MIVIRRTSFQTFVTQHDSSDSYHPKAPYSYTKVMQTVCQSMRAINHWILCLESEDSPPARAVFPVKMALVTPRGSDRLVKAPPLPATTAAFARTIEKSLIVGGKRLMQCRRYASMFMAGRAFKPPRLGIAPRRLPSDGKRGRVRCFIRNAGPKEGVGT